MVLLYHEFKFWTRVYERHKIRRQENETEQIG